MTDNQSVKYTYDTIKTDPRYAPIGDRVLFLEARVADLEELVGSLISVHGPDYHEVQNKARAKMQEHLEKAMKITGEKK